MSRLCLCILLITVSCVGQNTGYVVSILAGADRLNDGHSALNTLLRRPEGVAVDAAGNLYVSDSLDNRVRMVTAGIVSTVAGNGESGYAGDGGRATLALLDSPGSIVSDPAGNLYIADQANNVIRLLTPAGKISTYAGDGLSVYNGENLPATQAQFAPQALALDSRGNLYVSDLANHRIRKIDTAGNVTTVAGNGTAGYSGDGGQATAAEIGGVFGLAVDHAGNLYLADALNMRVRMVDTSGKIQTIAGNGTFYLGNTSTPAQNTPMLPTGVAVGPDGKLYITDLLNQQVFAVGPTDGSISTIAGSGNIGFSGDQGAAIAANLDFPTSPVFDSKGNLFFVDELNQRVREVSKYIITTVVGSGAGDGGPAASAYLNLPSDAFATSSGDVLIADLYNGEVRKVAAGSAAIGPFGQFGILSGNGNAISLAADSAGNVYTGTDAYSIVKTSPNGQTNLLAGTGIGGGSGDGGPAGTAQIDDPEGLAVDAQNNLYIADYAEEAIRKIGTDGKISHVAGTGNLTAAGDGGPAASATLDPADIAIDTQGNLLVADRWNNRIRKIGQDGKISTIIGNGHSGYAGDGGPASGAILSGPASIAVDSQNNLFIADEGNAVIRRVEASSGIITTVAGTGKSFPASGGSGPARGIAMDPRRVRVDAQGSLIVTDQLNDRVYRLSAVQLTPAQLSILSGDSQTGGPGTTLPLPLSVMITGSDGFGYPGLPVSFQVTSGDASVSAQQVLSDANGLASTSVTFGSSTGTATVKASAPGLTAVNFTLTAVNLPAINAGGVVGAGSSKPSVTALSPGSIVTIFGVQFAPAGTSHAVSSGDLVKGALPTTLAGVCVLMGGSYAPLFYVSATQVNAQVPQIPAPASSITVQVVSACGQPAELRSSPVVVASQLAAPEFFYADHSGNGKNYVAAIDAASGAYVGPSGLIQGGNFAPAKPGDIVTAYATGLGPTNPAFAVGVPAPAAAAVTQTVSVQLGGVTLAAQDVLYVGVSPTYSGLYQVNLRVPAGAAAGDQALVITIGGISSPANALLTIGK